MPVLATITVMTLLFRGESEHASFLAPAELEVRIAAIEDEATRQQVTELSKELRSLVPRYEAAVSETIEAYLVKLQNWQSSAEDLIELLDPFDQERIRTLEEIVRLRHAMRELLNANQWNQVFK